MLKLVEAQQARQAAEAAAQRKAQTAEGAAAVAATARANVENDAARVLLKVAAHAMRLASGAHRAKRKLADADAAVTAASTAAAAALRKGRAAHENTVDTDAALHQALHSADGGGGGKYGGDENAALVAFALRVIRLSSAANATLATRAKHDPWSASQQQLLSRSALAEATKAFKQAAHAGLTLKLF